MKVYHAYFSDYDYRCTVGIFTTLEKAKEALNHYIIEQTYYGVNDQEIEEFELDKYWNENCTKLVKALK